MDTAEMRLLTVPQFAKRVRRSEEEVLAMIQTRDVKALRPDPEGGYRVLETEVDRLLQERFTRIKPKKVEVKATSYDQTVPLEVHLAAVTSLENLREKNARLEGLNATLQSELFQYIRLIEESKREVLELKARTASSNKRLLQLEKAQMMTPSSKSWWQRVFGG